MCMAIGAAAPSNALANLVGSLTLMLLLLFGGFLLNKEAVPGYCAWVRRASFFNYAYEVRRARRTCTLVACTAVRTLLMLLQSCPRDGCSGQRWLVSTQSPGQRGEGKCAPHDTGSITAPA